MAQQVLIPLKVLVALMDQMDLVILSLRWALLGLVLQRVQKILVIQKDLAIPVHPAVLILQKVLSALQDR